MRSFTSKRRKNEIESIKLPLKLRRGRRFRKRSLRCSRKISARLRVSYWWLIRRKTGNRRSRTMPLSLNRKWWLRMQSVLMSLASINNSMTCRRPPLTYSHPRWVPLAAIFLCSQQVSIGYPMSQGRKLMWRSRNLSRRYSRKTRHPWEQWTLLAVTILIIPLMSPSTPCLKISLWWLFSNKSMNWTSKIDRWRAKVWCSTSNRLRTCLWILIFRRRSTKFRTVTLGSWVKISNRTLYF